MINVHNGPISIKDKIIVVTGGSGLIGGRFVEVGADHGAKIVVLDINDQQFVSKKLSSSGAVFLQCDVTKSESVNRAINKIKKRFNRIDVLVNGAYPRNKNYGRKFEDVTCNDFRENIVSNLAGCFTVTQAVVKVMKLQKEGNIINIGSIYGFSAPKFKIYKGTNMTSTVEYAVIKGGVMNLTKYLAAYLGPHNIRVNSLSPGGIFDRQPRRFVKRYSDNVPLGNRMANTDDLTAAFIFLASDGSRYVTGQNLVVDGGWSL